VTGKPVLYKRYVRKYTKRCSFGGGPSRPAARTSVECPSRLPLSGPVPRPEQRPPRAAPAPSSARRGPGRAYPNKHIVTLRTTTNRSRLAKRFITVFPSNFNQIAWSTHRSLSRLKNFIKHVTDESNHVYQSLSTKRTQNLTFQGPSSVHSNFFKVAILTFWFNLSSSN